MALHYHNVNREPREWVPLTMMIKIWHCDSLLPLVFDFVLPLYCIRKMNEPESAQCVCGSVTEDGDLSGVSLIRTPHGQRGSWHQLRISRQWSSYLTVSPCPGKTLKCLTKTSVLLDVADSKSPELYRLLKAVGSIVCLSKHSKAML